MPGKLALYFGCRDERGHFIHGIPTRRLSIAPKDDIPGFPWDIGHLDTGLLKNGKHVDREDGHVFWTCGGRPDLWFAFFWWDRSGDSRGNSNSGFYVRGFNFEEIVAAFDFACAVFPDIVKRQHFSLVLQDPTKGRSERSSVPAT